MDGDGGKLIRAFCVDGQRGNPAFVFATAPDQPVQANACIALAKRMQGEVTCIAGHSPRPRIPLRFFTPGGEIAFCGHGTLAAAAWLADHSGTLDSVEFEAGGISIAVSSGRRGCWSYTQQAWPSQDIAAKKELVEALTALGLPPDKAIGQPGATLARSIGATRDKLFVRLSNPETLSAIAVDGVRRDILCARHNVTGIYAFHVCADSRQKKIISRHFPIHCGAQEDMATAGIAPTLALHARLAPDNGDIIIDQGGPHCDNARLFVSSADGDSTWRIAGECVVDTMAATDHPA